MRHVPRQLQRPFLLVFLLQPSYQEKPVKLLYKPFLPHFLLLMLFAVLVLDLNLLDEWGVVLLLELRDHEHQLLMGRDHELVLEQFVEQVYIPNLHHDLDGAQ